MKSLSDIKRRMEVGSVLECVENTYRPELNGTRRIVSKAQGNGFFWKMVGKEEAGRMWTEYPPAKATSIVDANTFQLSLKKEAHYVRLRFVGAA